MALKAHLEIVPSQSLETLTNQPKDESRVQVEGRRQARRALRLETSGSVPHGQVANVTVHNLSAAGLLIETELELGVGEVLAVDLPQIGPVGAQVVWQSQQLFGCAFDQALGEAALAAAQLRGSVLTGAAPSAPGFVPNRQPTPTQTPTPDTPFGRRGLDSLGGRIRQLRREKGMTLAQVAAALGVSKPTVWAWEKGKARPLPERIGAIADVLGVSKDALRHAGVVSASSALVDECRLSLATEYGTEAKNIRIMIEI